MATVSNLLDVLSENGIKMQSIRPGRNEHVRCPQCDGGRTHEKSLSVTVDEDGQGAKWICHRGNCGWFSGARVHNDRVPPQSSRTVKPAPAHTEAQRSNRPDWLYDWFAERKIGARVVDKFGVYAGRKWFGEDLGELEAIVWPYGWRGDVVNRKYRPRQQKHPQAQEKDALPTLFNADALASHPEAIVWVEGEPDVLALAECGIDHAVSLKDGASKKANATNLRRFEALATHEDELRKVKKIVLAGDADIPGQACREELARRLGRHRCWLVTWPPGCKDAGDVLVQHGPDAVLEAIRTAEPYPIEGVQRLKPGSLLALRRRPAPTTMSTGTASSDAILKLPTEGRLIVVTGIPSHGKTSWTRFVMVHTAAKHSRRWCVFSPESQPWEEFVAQCAEAYMGKPFWPVGPSVASMTDDEIAEAETFLRDRVTMLVCDAEDEAPTLDWLLERFAACVLRDGVTDCLVDPWNEVEQLRGTLSETDYIGRALQRLKAFAFRHGVNVWIVAHPRTPPPTRANEKPGVPGPYSINGSSNWSNKTDVGITIHSPDTGLAQLHVWKTRLRRWGVRGRNCVMEYDELSGVYRTHEKTADPVGDMTPGQW